MCHCWRWLSAGGLPRRRLHGRRFPLDITRSSWCRGGLGGEIEEALVEQRPAGSGAPGTNQEAKERIEQSRRDQIPKLASSVGPLQVLRLLQRVANKKVGKKRKGEVKEKNPKQQEVKDGKGRKGRSKQRTSKAEQRREREWRTKQKTRPMDLAGRRAEDQHGLGPWRFRVVSRQGKGGVAPCACQCLRPVWARHCLQKGILKRRRLPRSANGAGETEARLSGPMAGSTAGAGLWRRCSCKGTTWGRDGGWTVGETGRAPGETWRDQQDHLVCPEPTLRDMQRRAMHTTHHHNTGSSDGPSATILMLGCHEPAVAQKPATGGSDVVWKIKRAGVPALSLLQGEGPLPAGSESQMPPLNALASQSDTASRLPRTTPRNRQLWQRSLRAQGTQTHTRPAPRASSIASKKKGETSTHTRASCRKQPTHQASARLTRQAVFEQV